MALVQKSDFSTYLDFVSQIPDSKVDFHIKIVEEVQLKHILSSEMVEALESATEVDTPELWEFLETHLTPFIVLKCASRIVKTHGVNLTQFGMNTPTDPRGTFQPVGKSSRTDLLDQVKGDLEMYTTDMYNALSSASWKFDGVQFTNPKSRPRSRKFGISGI